jgi:hypothetical protein
MDRRHAALALVLPFLALAPTVAYAGEGGEKKRAGGMNFVPVRTITGNVARADGRRGVFTVELGIDSVDPSIHERIVQYMPRLRDAFAASVQVFAASLRPDAVPNLDLLSQRLQAETDRVLGRRGARLLLGTCLVN